MPDATRPAMFVGIAATTTDDAAKATARNARSIL
jgi:hypothetical protein